MGDIEFGKPEEVVDREELNLTTFANDMNILGNQMKDRDLPKIGFAFGDGQVTNYLLWLILGELKIANEEKE